MNLYERIQELAKSKGLSIRQLEEAVGFGNGVIRRWASSSPGIDKVEKVANYLNVDIDFLLGRKEKNTPIKQEIDVENIVDELMFFGGEPVSDEEKEAIKGIIEGYLNTRK
ncbi:transcriptional regulator [Floricoccus tropicus]|uniref:Transcriptional regulator n=1 Tax=Floricoccus tropicus TaxID=1859473 RepID=A0A1E8GKR9_9LACT|nr:helix-turn-helix transcriptional regulator [Floricoccus tropicus]OFI48855.1 transcriptional regulator [Floricoccus tropicus]